MNKNEDKSHMCWTHCHSCGTGIERFHVKDENEYNVQKFIHEIKRCPDCDFPVDVMCEYDFKNDAPKHAGMQVLYCPKHTYGDGLHPDCERGFIDSVCVDGSYLVHYFRQNIRFPRWYSDLRTISGPERTESKDLYAWIYCDQDCIDNIMRILYGRKEK